MRRTGRAIACLILLVGGIVLGIEAYVLSDLRQFELPQLYRLIGPRGLWLIAALELGGLLVLALAWRVARNGSPVFRQSRLMAFLLALWLSLLLWTGDWLFLARPVSVRIADAFHTDSDRDRAVATASAYARYTNGDSDLATRWPHAEQRDVAVMVARIAVNKPLVFRDYRLLDTLWRYGAKYHVDPTLTLAWAYLDSFYGEASAGPLPYFDQMTGETFRDLVQIHLPSWFIESSLRTTLISSDWLERPFGKYLGGKLRYALQKANYDVSSDPFDTSIFSDGFLVLREYTSEFPELSDPADSNPLNVALRTSFEKLKDVTMPRPYDEPYSVAPRGPEFYAAYRRDLITFARAVYYKLQLDLDFAAKVQTLVAAYYLDQYEHSLGDAVWDRVAEPEKLALVAMLRDVYTPAIGRLGYNVYLLPEFNCTPIRFVVNEARADTPGLVSPEELWRPPHADYLWAGASYKLRSLAEVWKAAHGVAMPGLQAAETISDAIEVITRNRSRIEPAG